AAGTNRGAHRLFADAGAVVAHVALHHQIELDLHLRHAKGTGEDAVRARDTTRFGGAVHHAAVVLLDGVGGTDPGARRIFAVHANDRRGLHARGPVHVVEVNHRMPAMRPAFAARLHTRLAADAARGVDEEFGFGHGVESL